MIDGAIVEATRLKHGWWKRSWTAGGHPVAMTQMDGAPRLSIDLAADEAWTATTSAVRSVDALSTATSWKSAAGVMLAVHQSALQDRVTEAF